MGGVLLATAKHISLTVYGNKTIFLSTLLQKDTTKSDSLKKWSNKKVSSSYPLYFNADSVPNVDIFTREELKAFVKKFKDDFHSGGLNDVS